MRQQNLIFSYILLLAYISNNLKNNKIVKLISNTTGRGAGIYETWRHRATQEAIDSVVARPGRVNCKGAKRWRLPPSTWIGPHLLHSSSCCKRCWLSVCSAVTVFSVCKQVVCFTVISHYIIVPVSIIYKQ